MKELSIEQKAKRYDEALEKAKNYHSPETVCNVRIAMENLFPELKESEDEKIRKALMQNLKERFGTKGNMGEGLDMPDVLAWLEKQGEQKPVDKAEPKFHKGDWINGYYTNYKVLSVNNEGYEVEDTDGNKINILFENEKFHHLWTIQDAKDGDVLACNEEILLFKSYSVQGRISLHCWYNGQTNNFHSKEVVDTLMTTRNKICPATKEQRDLLFSKIKEAGYEWDAEKKELKKVEQKSSWSEENEAIVSRAISIVKWAAYSDHSHPILNDEGATKLVEWLKSLKERYTWKPSNDQKSSWSEEDEERLSDAIFFVREYQIPTRDKRLFNAAKKTEDWLRTFKDKVQPKQEWSEEDKRKIDRIYSVLWQAADTHAFSTTCRLIGDKECVELQDFLKSLRPQNTWKPSDEQIKVCKEVYADILSAKGFDLGTINSELNRMEEQLNKLKENKL